MIFVAEAGLNHNGNHSLCYELIKQAKYSGADIVKFQLGWRSGKGEINNYDYKTLKKLKDWSEEFEIELMFSVFNIEALKMVKKLNIKRIKIASRTLIEEFEVVKKAVSTGKQTFISLGMWDKKDVPIKNKKNISYLYCVSKYPTEIIDLKNFPKNFHKSNYSGYSDHSIGIETSLIAISRGASIIEKHFTLDKSDTTIRDHALSATPDEFSNLVRIGKNISYKLNKGL